MRSRARSAVLLAFMASAACASSMVMALNPGGCGEGRRPSPIPASATMAFELQERVSNYSVPKLEGRHPEYLVSRSARPTARASAHLAMHSRASSLVGPGHGRHRCLLQRRSREQGQQPGRGQAARRRHQFARGLSRATTAWASPASTRRSPPAGTPTPRARDPTTRRAGRKNAIMGTFARQIKEEDIRVLAQYYTRQKPRLETRRAARSLVLPAGNPEEEGVSIRSPQSPGGWELGNSESDFPALVGFFDSTRLSASPASPETRIRSAW